MISAGAALAFNHLLEQDGSARALLAAHGGARIEFRSPPFPTLRLTILPDGLLSASAPLVEEELAELIVTLNPFALPWLAVQRGEALKHVDFSGPEALAGVVRQLMQTIRWDVEEDLSRVVGDVAAHRAVQTSHRVLQWQREAGERLARNFSEYWTEEQRLLAQRNDVGVFGAELKDLHDRLARLEERLAVRQPRPRPAA